MVEGIWNYELHVYFVKFLMYRIESKYEGLDGGGGGGGRGLVFTIH